MSDPVTRTDDIFSSEEAVEMGVVSIKDIQRSLFRSTLGRPRFVRLGQPDHPSLQVAIPGASAELVRRVRRWPPWRLRSLVQLIMACTVLWKSSACSAQRSAP